MARGGEAPSLERLPSTGRRWSGTGLTPFRYHGYAEKKGFLPQLSSGGRATINYTFCEVGGGTLFQRVLEYSSPNWLMVVFDKLMFHNAVIVASTDALLNVKKNLEAKVAEK